MLVRCICAADTLAKMYHITILLALLLQIYAFRPLKWQSVRTESSSESTGYIRRNNGVRLLYRVNGL